jgi:diadenosine tetraphosphate (Ap4A) HIT family hydrolase
VTSCIFCSRSDQPAALFETERLYVMPDKFPICPGHTLIISKEHLACYGAATADLQRELEQAAQVARSFLTEAYGKPLFVWENGVSGQSVYHAHLHLMPLPIDAIPPEIEAHPDVATVDSWDAVRDYFGRHGRYRYLDVAGQRRLVAGHSPALRSVVELLARATGLGYGRDGWIKTTTPEDVAEVGRRYILWRNAEYRI